MPVPLLNRHEMPAFSSDEVVMLWGDSVELPAGAGLDEEARQRTRLSRDGQWVLRFLHTKQHSANQVADIARQEYHRLAGLGLSVLSFAGVPVVENAIVTISPWIDGLETCSEAVYNQQVSPLLNEYFRSSPDSVPRLSMDELRHHSQYSLSAAGTGPILHDVDPMIAGITAYN